MKFSPRLKALYEECLPGQPLFDLCCDHGHLGVHAYLSQRFPEVVFVDQVPHTVEMLETKFNRYVREDTNPTQVRFVCTDAASLTFEVGGNVVVAGIGGVNMLQILTRLHGAQLLKPRALILSPHRHRELFEEASLFGLRRKKVTEITEKGLVRPIFVFAPGD